MGCRMVPFCPCHAATTRPPCLKCLTHSLSARCHQAAAHGIRLILAVGNLWPAYKGPEDWPRGNLRKAAVVEPLSEICAPQAFTTGAGLQGPDVDVVDFYASPGARYLYR
eukprot:105752-Pelagomonas_calceolata.AAC.2